MSFGFGFGCQRNSVPGLDFGSTIHRSRSVNSQSWQGSIRCQCPLSQNFIQCYQLIFIIQSGIDLLSGFLIENESFLFVFIVLVLINCYDLIGNCIQFDLIVFFFCILFIYYCYLIGNDLKQTWNNKYKELTFYYDVISFCCNWEDWRLRMDNWLNNASHWTSWWRHRSSHWKTARKLLGNWSKTALKLL